MTRDVFPRAPDRQVIDFFLAGASGYTQLDAGISADSVIAWLPGPRLRILSDIDWVWYAPDGSLMFQVGTDLAGGQTIRGLNYMAEKLGIPERICREPGNAVGEPTRYLMGDGYLDLGRATLLAGPLVIKAYRSGYV